MYKIDFVLAPPILIVCGLVAYKIIKDIVEMKDNRPAVTDAMVEQAWRNQVMDDFDDEFDSIDWEDRL